jgi:hypothetical protein
LPFVLLRLPNDTKFFPFFACRIKKSFTKEKREDICYSIKEYALLTINCIGEKKMFVTILKELEITDAKIENIC